MAYIWGVGAAQGHGDVELIPCFCTILGDWCGGSAAYFVGTWGPEPPRNPGYPYTGYCVLAVGYVESGVVGNYEYEDGNGFPGVTGDGRLHCGGGTRTTEGPLLLCRMRAALFLCCRFAPDR